MKKLDKSLSKEYPPLKIYLDDLEQIEEVLSDASESISIETQDYSFASIEDFAGNYSQKRINTLRITSTNPYVTVEFNPLSCRLYVSSSSTNASGIFYKLDQIIHRHILPVHWLYSIGFLLTLSGIFLVSSQVALKLPSAISIAIPSICPDNEGDVGSKTT